MDNSKPIIDHQFGLRQLSGNAAILHKLLNKFHAQYSCFADTLNGFVANRDHRAIKDAVHTVKGISGNLGLFALHEQSKTLELQISDEIEFSPALQQFLTLLQLTLDEIAELDAQTNVTSNKIGDSAASDTLRQLLVKNEFIPDEQLQLLLSRIRLDEKQKDILAKAINDLDYAQAIDIIDTV